MNAMATVGSNKALAALRIVESVVEKPRGSASRERLKRADAIDAGLELGRRLVDMAERDDVDGVIEGLNRALTAVGNVQEMRAAATRGFDLKRRLVESGELLPAAEIHRLGGPTPQALHKGQATGRYFALSTGGREQYYPAFFAERNLEEHGLFRVLKILKDESPWAKWVFLTTRSAGLGNRSPLEVLRSGRDLGKVVSLAQATIER
jgi:hypothetical protein